MPCYHTTLYLVSQLKVCNFCSTGASTHLCLVPLGILQLVKLLLLIVLVTAIPWFKKLSTEGFPVCQFLVNDLCHFLASTCGIRYKTWLLETPRPVWPGLARMANPTHIFAICCYYEWAHHHFLWFILPAPVSCFFSWLNNFICCKQSDCPVIIRIYALCLNSKF